jgi:hypothetical protein
MTPRNAPRGHVKRAANVSERWRLPGVKIWMLAAALAASLPAQPLPKDDGYRGIWYFNQPSQDEFKYKYSGGFATYPQQHAPIAIYSKAANKTFFCYGGTVQGKQELLHMVSYYDHATGRVPRPTILLNKKTQDAHDNPTISIDAEGYIWIFSSAHGIQRPSYIHKSKTPYSIDEFELIEKTNFSYTQPWYFAGQGFLFLHTRYSSGRGLFEMTSPDGLHWDAPRQLAFALMGHYQISWPWREKLGTAFDVHPPPLGLNERTNLYYMETADFGRTWKTVDGRAVELPVTEEKSVALVRDYRSEKLLVYLKDLNYDAAGRPAIVYLTASSFESGPKGGPRNLMLARWTGTAWRYSKICVADHNYDHGSLYIEGKTWRFIGPSGPGPQKWATGGEIEVWTSTDDGQTWKKSAELTRNSRYNHTYVRRPLNAHPDFYAFWADGDAFGESESRLYFSTRNGNVFRLPAVMKNGLERPERIK